MKRQIVLTSLLALLALGAAYMARDISHKVEEVEDIDPELALYTTHVPELAYIEIEQTPNLSGQFLASHLAQAENDWKKANDFLDEVLQFDPENIEHIKRSMILAMGYGDIDFAAKRAKRLVESGDTNSLARVILSVQAMAAGNMEEAVRQLEKMEPGDITDYVSPILMGWAKAGLGEAEPDTMGMGTTTLHSFHGALIALFLKDKEHARQFIDALMSVPILNPFEAERVADLMVLAGDYEQARELYKKALLGKGRVESLKQKLALLEKDPQMVVELMGPLHIETVAHGAALAMYDMADLLFRENSDNSARLFAHMALTLNPALNDARFMLADMAARDDREEDAIVQLKAIPETHPQYLETQYAIADLLADIDKQDEALAHLEGLFEKHKGVELLIRIGDLYRQVDEYGEALVAYNKAVRMLDGDVPEKYWHLLYARGMAYEHEGQWDKAEKDLKAALVYRPNHPFLLNYLGYGWADQGVHLEESLDMIAHAAALRPEDGYISDSLGWVYYMMEDYEKALPPLEKAVELLPYDATLNDHLGDAYWRVGRRLEARFQWERGLNNNEDNVLDEDMIQHKLRYGLDVPFEVKQAQN